MNNHILHLVHAQLLRALQHDERSDTELSRLTGVSQPTIWRLRHNRSRRARTSKSFNTLCIFYGLNELSDIASANVLEEQLKGAIMTLWDGTDAHAHALLKVIRDLKGLVQAQAQAIARGEQNAGNESH